MSPQPQSNAPVTELEAALSYANHGVAVFPTNPLDKKPLTANGFNDATRDETQIREWWTKWPNAMVAAPTGAVSGMWVIDLDLDPGKKIDGPAAFAQLIAQHGQIPQTLMSSTPRGGRHLFFAWDRSVEIRNSAGKIGPGIDVRGEGGYVCLPPSRNANGGVYRWDPDGDERAIRPPIWLVELARSRPKARNTAWARSSQQYCEWLNLGVRADNECAPIPRNPIATSTLCSGNGRKLTTTAANLQSRRKVGLHARWLKSLGENYVCLRGAGRSKASSTLIF
jgi:Bifunctional DNA primase/polymerase, N-terminal